MRRLSFAAPFVLVAACHHGGSKQPQTHNYAEWSLQRTADGCTAYDALPPDCPEGAVCNPPAPIDVQCPDGMVTPTIMVVQPMVGGECYTQPEDGTAPQQVSCPKRAEE